MEIHFEIENRCLLHCRHCSSYSSREMNNMGYEVSDMTNLIKNFRNPIDIYLTGGEPLLNENLVSIMKEIIRVNSNHRIGLFTTGIRHDENGRLCAITEEYARELKDAGVTNCYLSIYSHKREEHEMITCLDSSFELTHEAASNLIKAGIIVNANVVVTKKNISNLEKIITRLQEEGFSQIRFLKLVNHGLASLNWDEFGVLEEEYINAIKRIFEKRSDYSVDITISGFPQLVKCRPFKEAIKCQAGTKLLYVTFGGDVFPCACVKNNDKLFISKVSEYSVVMNFLEKQSEYNEHCLSCRGKNSGI